MPSPKGAGDLRQRVSFSRRVEETDEYGNAEGGWANIGVERACSLAPTRGGETVQAGRLAGAASWDLWVRNDSGTRSVRTGDRVLNVRDETQTFNIVFGPADMDGERRWLFLQIVSGGADG